VKHHQTALQVRQLFFGCTSVLGKLNPGLETEPDLHDAYWKIVGPYPNW
jgi:hypothetical protein